MQLKLSLDRDDCNPINLARESELCFVIRHIDSNDRLVRTSCLAGAKAGIDACDPRPAQDLCFDPFLCSDSILDGVNGNLLPSETTRCRMRPSKPEFVSRGQSRFLWNCSRAGHDGPAASGLRSEFKSREFSCEIPGIRRHCRCIGEPIRRNESRLRDCYAASGVISRNKDARQEECMGSRSVRTSVDLLPRFRR